MNAHHRALSWLLCCGMALGLATGVLILPGCGGSSSSGGGAASSSSPPSSSSPGSSSDASASGPSILSPYTALTGPNVQPITVDSAFAYGYPNEPLTSVAICVPGTPMCQTIPNILVDTGSSGLRIIGSQLSLALPAVTSGSAPLGECLEFVDAFVWGPVVTADVLLADEEAAAVPIQIMGSPNFPAPPRACASSGLPEADTVETFGANGVLGVGVFAQDCGPACSPQSPGVPAIYFRCPSAEATCAPTSVPLTNQVQNPVWRFPQNNNGVIISLPPIDPGGVLSVGGTLVFGIGTASNNGLGHAQVYTTDAAGTFTTTYAGRAYPGSFLDTGASVLFILDPQTLGIPVCAAHTIASGAYCPSATVSTTATTTGANSTSGMVAFSIANANTLLSSPNAAFNDLAVPFGATPEAFVWGLPFFFGRNVFVAIEGQRTPAGAGPYWAY